MLWMRHLSFGLRMFLFVASVRERVFVKVGMFGGPDFRLRRRQRKWIRGNCKSLFRGILNLLLTLKYRVMRLVGVRNHGVKEADARGQNTAFSLANDRL